MLSNRAPSYVWWSAALRAHKAQKHEHHDEHERDDRSSPPDLTDEQSDDHSDDR